MKVTEHFGVGEDIARLVGELDAAIAKAHPGLERVLKQTFIALRSGKRTVASIVPRKRRVNLVLPLDPASLSGSARQHLILLLAPQPAHGPVPAALSRGRAPLLRSCHHPGEHP